MFLLELLQGEHTHKIGLFPTEEQVIAWIEQIPFVRKDQYTIDEVEFVTYALMKEEIPVYAEVEWQGYVVPFTRYMLPDDENEAIFVWYKMHCFNEQTNERQMVDGMTRVDAYTVMNDEVETYIIQRNELYEEAKHYFESRGSTVERGGEGSEDGEYVLVDGAITFHLDASSLADRAYAENFEQFIAAYQ